jgi:hypothetical protein
MFLLHRAQFRGVLDYALRRPRGGPMRNFEAEGGRAKRDLF